MRFLLLSCVINSFFFGIFTGFPANAQLQNTEAMKTGVVHSERLVPLKGAVKIGQILPEQFFAESADGRWFEIPNWFAGTWRTIQGTRLSLYDDRTGEADDKPIVIPSRERETFGFQLDRARNVWTSSGNIVPIAYSAELKFVNAEGDEVSIPVLVSIFRENHLLKVEKDVVSIRSVDLVITSRKDTKQVQSVERREVVRRFTLIEPTVIAVYSDVQTYDSTGFPEKRETICEFRKRENEFRVQNQYRSVGLFSSFSKYLQSTGKIGLVPEKHEAQ